MRAEPAGTQDVLVATRAERPGQSPVDLVWRVRPREGRYLVIDVMFEGVSLALTKREEFASIIQNSGGRLDILIARLNDSTT